jgi:hypothetical protein
MFDEPERRAEIDAELRHLYGRSSSRRVPRPSSGAEPARPRCRGRRLPLVECDEGETAQVREALAGLGLLEAAPTR